MEPRQTGGTMQATGEAAPGLRLPRVANRRRVLSQFHSTPYAVTQRRTDALLLLATVVLIGALLGTRLWRLDRVVTPDEPLWIGRSSNFYRALVEHDFAKTYQHVHPGVTVMWAGALGYWLDYRDFTDRVPANETTTALIQIDRPLEEYGYNALDILVTLRRVIVIVNVAVLAGILWTLWRLTSPGIALLAVFLVGFDPFQIAYARLLHLDALAAGLLILSPLILLRYLRGHGARYFALSALIAALAWLTRSSGFLLGLWTGAMFGLVALDRCWQARRIVWSEIWLAVRRQLIWTAIAFACTFVLWPALWVAPVATLKEFLTGTVELAEEAHIRQIFFDGRVTTQDPGWTFYPLSLLWRMTPTAMVGIVLAVAGCAVAGAAGLSRHLKLLVLYLAVFALAYGVLLSTGGKKLDRYVLPIAFIADVIAGIGWFWFLGRLVRIDLGGSLAAVGRFVAPAIAALVVLAQIGMTAAASPYYLQYYNPALGGLRGAEDVMMIGWGEGYDQIGRWLNAQPDAASLRVTTGPWPPSLDYFFVGHVQTQGYSSFQSFLEQWLHTDILVVSYDEVQRRLFPPLAWNYLQQNMTPAAVAEVDGEPMMWAYDLRGLPVPEEFIRAAPLYLEWGGLLRLIDLNAGVDKLSRGHTIGVTLTLDWIGTPSDRLRFQTALVNQSTGVRYSLDLNLADAVPDEHGYLVLSDRLRIPADAPTGKYALCVTAISNSLDTAVPGTNPTLAGSPPVTEHCGPVVRVIAKKSAS